MFILIFFFPTCERCLLILDFSAVFTPTLKPFLGAVLCPPSPHAKSSAEALQRLGAAGVGFRVGSLLFWYLQPPVSAEAKWRWQSSLPGEAFRIKPSGGVDANVIGCGQGDLPLNLC